MSLTSRLIEEGHEENPDIQIVDLWDAHLSTQPHKSVSFSLHIKGTNPSCWFQFPQWEDVNMTAIMESSSSWNLAKHCTYIIWYPYRFLNGCLPLSACGNSEYPLHTSLGMRLAFYRMETDYLQLKGWSLTWLFSWVLWKFWNNMEGGSLHTKKLMWSLYYKTSCMWTTFNSLALSDNIFKGAGNWGMVNAGWPGYACMCVCVCIRMCVCMCVCVYVLVM